jgi:hypothetical protein
MKTLKHLIGLIFVLIISSISLYGDKLQDTIDVQIANDMMYGSDDYFGENYSISSADRIVPTVNQPVQPIAVISQPQQNSSNEKTIPLLPNVNRPVQSPNNSESITIISPEPPPDDPPPPPPDDPF